MQIKSLEYLLALERHGTINKAASASYISQQGMSRVMNSMERELGVTLFARSHNGIAHQGGDSSVPLRSTNCPPLCRNS